AAGLPRRLRLLAMTEGGGVRGDLAPREGRWGAACAPAPRRHCERGEAVQGRCHRRAGGVPRRPPPPGRAGGGRGGGRAATRRGEPPKGRRHRPYWIAASAPPPRNDVGSGVGGDLAPRDGRREAAVLRPLAVIASGATQSRGRCHRRAAELPRRLRLLVMTG